MTLYKFFFNDDNTRVVFLIIFFVYLKMKTRVNE